MQTNVSKMYRMSGNDLSMPNVSEMLMFPKYDSFMELLASGIIKPSDFGWYYRSSGKLGGVSLNNYGYFSSLDCMSGVTSNLRSWELKNIYDGFQIIFQYFGFKRYNMTGSYNLYCSRSGYFKTESKVGEASSLEMTNPRDTFSFPTMNK